MGRRWTWAIACLVLVAVPFFAVDTELLLGSLGDLLEPAEAEIETPGQQRAELHCSRYGLHEFYLRAAK